jgi:hypothetical protein
MIATPDHRLPDLIVTLGLEKQITWEQAERILDVWENHKQTIVGPREANARDLAFMLHCADAPPSMWPKFWHGATPDAAFLLDLSTDNPGDHSGLHLRTPEQLLADLIALRLLPNSAWKRERVAATIAERKLRDPRSEE